MNFRIDFFQGALACLLLAILPLEHVPALRKALLVTLFLMALYQNIKKISRLLFLAWPVLAWFGFCTLSWFWSDIPSLTADHLKHDLLYAFLGFVIFADLAEKKHFGIFVNAGVFLCAFLNAITAFLGYQLKYESINYYYADVGYSSTIAVITMAFAVPLLLQNYKSKFAWGTLLFSLIAGICSANRMFYLCLLLLIAALPFVVMKRSFPYRKNAISLLLVVLPIFLLMFYWIGDSFILNKFLTFNVAGSVRFKIWQLWLDLGLENFWLGSGYGRSVEGKTLEIAEKAILLAVDPLAGMHSHNMFLNSFVETGIIGLALFLAMWTSFSYRFIVSARKHCVYGLQGVAIVILFVFKNQTDIFILKSTIVLIFGLIGYLFSKVISPQEDKRL